MEKKIRILYIYNKIDNLYDPALIIETEKEYYNNIFIIQPEGWHFTRKKISKYFFISKKCLIRIFYGPLENLTKLYDTYILRDFELTKKDIYQILSNGLVILYHDQKFITNYINHLIPYI